MSSEEIEQIFQDLPPGIWDHPNKEDSSAYKEFLEVWNADESELKQHWLETADTDNTTLRALAYSCLTKGCDCTSGHMDKYDVIHTADDGMWNTPPPFGFDTTAVEFGGYYIMASGDTVQLPPDEPILTTQDVGYHSRSCFCRFPNVDIPPASEGAVINYARLKFWAADNTPTGTPSAVISGIEAHQSPDSAYEAQNWERTDNRVYWSDAGNWELDQIYYSPNIACVIQEIIDGPSWMSGDDILCFLDGYGTAINEAYDYSADASKSTDLEIWWVMNYHEVMQGGVVCDGTTPNNVILQETMVGGVLLGTSADVSKITVVPTAVHGKVLLDGANPPSLSMFMLGGVRVSGSAAHTLQMIIAAKGGLKLNGSVERYPSGHLYRTMIRVPIGKVSTLLTDYPLMLSWVIDANKRHTITGQEDFYFETTTGLPLPFKLVRWDGQRVHILVKTDLTPEDNWIVCYFGGIQ